METTSVSISSVLVLLLLWIPSILEQDLASLSVGPHNILSLALSCLHPRYGTSRGLQGFCLGSVLCLVLGILSCNSWFGKLVGSEAGWERCLLQPAEQDTDLLASLVVELVSCALYQEGRLSLSMLTCTLLWYLFIFITWLLHICK